MQPILSMTYQSQGNPNLELLRRQGWQIGTYRGPYCVAWKGSTEVLLVWRDHSWQRLSGRGDL